MGQARSARRGTQSSPLKTHFKKYHPRTKTKACSSPYSVQQTTLHLSPNLSPILPLGSPQLVNRHGVSRLAPPRPPASPLLPPPPLLLHCGHSERSKLDRTAKAPRPLEDISKAARPELLAARRPAHGLDGALADLGIRRTCIHYVGGVRERGGTYAHMMVAARLQVKGTSRLYTNIPARRYVWV